VKIISADGKSLGSDVGVQMGFHPVAVAVNFAAMASRVDGGVGNGVGTVGGDDGGVAADEMVGLLLLLAV
jgi:hypothetical protein